MKEIHFFLTGGHSIPVCASSNCYSPASQIRKLSASDVNEGDFLLRADVHSSEDITQEVNWSPVRILRISRALRTIRYLLTVSDTALVNSIASYTYSTRAGFLETVPFKALYSVSPWLITNNAVGMFGNSFTLISISSTNILSNTASNFPFWGNCFLIKLIFFLCCRASSLASSWVPYFEVIWIYCWFGCFFLVGGYNWAGQHKSQRGLKVTVLRQFSRPCTHLNDICGRDRFCFKEGSKTMIAFLLISLVL